MRKQRRSDDLFWGVLSFFLCLLMVFSVASCAPTATNTGTATAGEPNNGQAEKMTEEPTRVTAEPTVANTIAAAPGDGLTAEEAIELARSEINSSSDLVLWRLVPVNDKESTRMMLDADWQQTGRSAEWFVWYAINDSTNWFLIGIEGDEIAHYDIGTRSSSTISMDASLPREAPPVTMLEAAVAAEAQGAYLDGLTWVEYACDYGLAAYRYRPLWAFACSQDTNNGSSLNYRVFVDALTGEVIGAANDRNEAMDLPIDLEALQQTRTETHEADLRQFFQFITDGDPGRAVLQLSSTAAPDIAASQVWLKNFQSIQSLEIVSIEQADLAQWTDKWECYRVVFEVETSASPDQYGWENGQNTRWVIIVPQGAGGWKINALSTSP